MGETYWMVVDIAAQEALYLGKDAAVARRHYDLAIGSGKATSLCSCVPDWEVVEYSP